MKNLWWAGLFAVVLGVGACTESDNIVNYCSIDASPGSDCNIDAGADGDADTDSDADDKKKPDCENIFRPKWECAPVLTCSGPRDLNMNVLADVLDALNLPYTRYRCPATLPVCCVRDYFPERPEDGGVDSGADGG